MPGSRFLIAVLRGPLATRASGGPRPTFRADRWSVNFGVAVVGFEILRMFVDEKHGGCAAFACGNKELYVSS